jgi:hypothetical protein
MAEGLGIVAKLASGRHFISTVRFLPINLPGFVETRVSIDNWGFKFYYKYTTALLVLFTAGTTARSGEPG